MANERRKRPLKGALCVNARFWNRELRKRLNGQAAENDGYRMVPPKTAAYVAEFSKKRSRRVRRPLSSTRIPSASSIVIDAHRPDAARRKLP